MLAFSHQCGATHPEANCHLDRHGFCMVLFIGHPRIPRFIIETYGDGSRDPTMANLYDHTMVHTLH